MERDPFTENPGPSWIVVSAFEFDDLRRSGPDDDVICPGCPGSSDPGSFRSVGESAGRSWAAFTCGHLVVSAADAPASATATDRGRRAPAQRSDVAVGKPRRSAAGTAPTSCPSPRRRPAGPRPPSVRDRTRYKRGGGDSRDGVEP